MFRHRSSVITSPVCTMRRGHRGPVWQLAGLVEGGPTEVEVLGSDNK